MPIPVEKEDDVELGPLSRVREHCCFCRKPTSFWVSPITGESVACCDECARRYEPAELPTKREWCDGLERLSVFCGFRLNSELRERLWALTAETMRYAASGIVKWKGQSFTSACSPLRSFFQIGHSEVEFLQQYLAGREAKFPFGIIELTKHGNIERIELYEPRYSSVPTKGL